MFKRHRKVAASAVFAASTLWAGVSAADSGSHTCVLGNVAYWNISGELRIAAACTTASAGGISYFAIAISDANVANRFLSMMTTALVSKRSVIFDWNQASTPNAAGCQAGNCRTPRSWTLL